MIASKNLWGDIPVQRVLPDPPSKVLRDQGDILTEATSGVLLGDVRQSIVNKTRSFESHSTSRDSQHNDFETEINRQFFTAVLRIKVPSLGGYIFELLSIQYPVDFYPLRVRDYVNEEIKDCQNLADYEYALEGILSSENVKSVITALLAQVSDSASDVAKAG